MNKSSLLFLPLSMILLTACGGTNEDLKQSIIKQPSSEKNNTKQHIKHSSSESDKPEEIIAQAKSDDPYWPYITRPTKAQAVGAHTYPQVVLDKVPDKYNPLPLDLIRDPTLATRDTFVPWVFDTEYRGKKAILLKDLVPDRIKDPVTGKKYIPLYHGTVVDYKDVFRKGAAHIDFGRAGNVEGSMGAVIGRGFYMAGSINAAKHYACLSFSKPGVSKKAIVVVVGIEENPADGTEIRGDSQAKSNDLGESRDLKLFFNYLRGEFAFFTNTRPYMKILKIIELPSDFSATDGVFSDVSGLASTDSWAAKAPKCLKR